MILKRHPRFLPACILAILGAGCGSPATFTVETVVHPDGSCERTICQPRAEYLPAEALERGPSGRIAPAAVAQPLEARQPLRPEWVARWKSVKVIKGPPSSPRSGLKAGTEDYLVAVGSFRSPREIPPHYRYANEKAPEAGVSELRRTYERRDHVFVADHRWSETVTNIVTLAGFLEARDALLDLALPWAVEHLEKEFGPDYDVSRLSAFLRTDVRHALEEACLILYDDAIARRRGQHAGGTTMDTAVVRRLAALSRRLGFDPLDAKGNLVTDQEVDRRINGFVRDVLLKYVRHRDGKALDPADADALIARVAEAAGSSGPDWRLNEAFDRQAGRLLLRMMGLYDIPLAFLFRGSPRYEFTLRLPGELIETNGTGLRGGRTRWRFTGDQMFPDGYEMRARSLEIDRDAQRKALGRVAIDDEETALEFLDLIGDDKALLEAVRKLKDTGDRSALQDEKGRVPEQILRARRLRQMLLGR